MRQGADRFGEIVLVRLGWAAIGAIGGGVLVVLMAALLWWLDLGGAPEAGRLILGWLPGGFGAGALVGLVLGPYVRPMAGWVLRFVADWF